jgi:hypothetical protein
MYNLQQHLDLQQKNSNNFTKVIIFSNLKHLSQNVQNSKTIYIEFQQVATKPILMSCNKNPTSSNKTYYEKLHQNFDKPKKTHFDKLQLKFDTSWNRA